MSQCLHTGRYLHQMDFPTQTPRDLFFLLLDSEICQHYGATRPQKQKKRNLEQNGILVESEKENPRMGLERSPEEPDGSRVLEDEKLPVKNDLIC